jgi:diguanylate cyclase (GGDEF)-like protein
MTGRSTATDLVIKQDVAGTCNVTSTYANERHAILALINRLHLSLDIQQLIVSFIGEVRHTLPCDGIEYRHDETKLYYIDGAMAQHSCRYGIRHIKEFLGEIIFTREYAFQEHELYTIETIVSGLIQPLRNALRYQQAMHFSQKDELTGLRSGSYCHDSIEMEIRRAHRYEIPFSLLLLDLDRFREINEKYGRYAGDTILVEIAKRSEQAVRNSDIVFRYSGDRFLVFLPNTTASEASVLAKRFKQHVQLKTFLFMDYEIQLTLSIGIVTVSQIDTRDNLIDRMNKALLNAKLRGKDRIHLDALHECVLGG